MTTECDTMATSRLDSRDQPYGRQQRRKGTPVRLGHSAAAPAYDNDTSDESEPPTPSDDDRRSVKSEPMSANSDEVEATPVDGGSDSDYSPDRLHKSRRTRSRSKLRCSARLASVLADESRLRSRTNETDSNASSDDFVVGDVTDHEEVDLTDRRDDDDVTVPAAEEEDEVMSGQNTGGDAKPKKGPNMFRCPHCPYEINNKVRYKVHMSKHDKSITIHRCHFCHEPFQTAEKLSLHVGRRHANGPTTYECVHCQGLFTTTNYRRYHRHLRSVHGVTGRGDKAAQIIRCPDCDYTCLFASELVQHRPRHDKVKRFKCQLCDYASVRPFDLVKHSRIKHDEVGLGADGGGDRQSQLRSFVCETCGFATYTISKLANHRLKHTGDKPYQCKQCPKAFRDRTTFRRHGRVHQPGYGAYACLVCGQVFKRRHFMVGHLLRVHQIEMPADQEVTAAAATTTTEDVEERNEAEIPLAEENATEQDGQMQEASLFRCPICQKAFKSWNSLNAHLKRVHSTNLL